MRKTCSSFMKRFSEQVNEEEGREWEKAIPDELDIEKESEKTFGIYGRILDNAQNE